MDAPTTISAQKKLLRRDLLRLLWAIPEREKQASDEAIRLRLASLPQYQQATSLFIFVGDGWEVDTWPLIEAALAEGKQIAVPRCLPGGLMEACLIRSRGELRQTPPLGLWEPGAGAAVLPTSQIDFALIPCIACDANGLRLGRGGGYYDRFLTGAGFIKAAVCRQAVLQDTLPTEPHDEAVDVVVTESALYGLRSM